MKGNLLQSMSLNFSGVFPAITTPFLTDGAVDYAFLKTHIEWMLESGCHGIIPLGSLGEGGTLTSSEKRDVLEACLEACGDRAPVVPGIAGLSTQEAIQLAKDAESMGCGGLMVLPPYAYSTDWREMKAHVSAVIEATKLSCILYNNPVAYKTDFLPDQIQDLAREYNNLIAVKESSTDVRRVTWIRSILGDRLTIMVGVDDAIVEGIRAGASGWVAGLVNAFPKESVALWRLALERNEDAVDRLYSWFLPLLRLDTVPKFVQLIKLTQERVGMGSERVRPPRLVLLGHEREEALCMIEDAIRERPQL